MAINLAPYNGVQIGAMWVSPNDLLNAARKYENASYEYEEMSYFISGARVRIISTAFCCWRGDPTSNTKLSLRSVFISNNFFKDSSYHGLSQKMINT